MDKLVVERLGPFNRQDVFQARKASYREYRRSYSQRVLSALFQKSQQGKAFCIGEEGIECFHRET